MLPLDGSGFSNRILQVRGDGTPIDGHGALPDVLPDLSDPATLGCLLALVREAWGAHDLHVRPSPEGTHWRVYRCATSLNQGWADSEAKALVGALEAAP
jgi:hypothetical protein